MLPPLRLLRLKRQLELLPVGILFIHHRLSFLWNRSLVLTPLVSVRGRLCMRHGVWARVHVAQDGHIPASNSGLRFKHCLAPSKKENQRIGFYISCAGTDLL